MTARILVMEDDDCMRELLRLHLSNAGYDVSVAADPLAAGHMILQQAPDLLIADVDLPYMDGFQFVEVIRSDPAVSAIPVIFLTATEDEESRGAQLGAVGYMTKPVLADQLLALVATRLPPPWPVSAVSRSKYKTSSDARAQEIGV